MNTQSGRIPVVVSDSDNETVRIRIAHIKVCSECGARKAVRKFRKKFLCADCKQLLLEEEDEKDERLENS